MLKSTKSQPESVQIVNEGIGPCMLDQIHMGAVIGVHCGPRSWSLAPLVPPPSRAFGLWGTGGARVHERVSRWGTSSILFHFRQEAIRRNFAAMLGMESSGGSSCGGVHVTFKGRHEYFHYHPLRVHKFKIVIMSPGLLSCPRYTVCHYFFMIILLYRAGLYRALRSNICRRQYITD